MSITDRLGRLLFIVPYVANRGGVPLAELAQKTGATVAQIEADLDLLAMVGQPPLTPDHLIDLYVEDDVVYVDLDQSLSRPLRLTHEEARALVLGAKLVGHLGGLGDELQAVLDKIIAKLNPVDREIVQSLAQRVAVWQDAGGPAAPSTELRAAIDARREVEIDYYSASSDRQKSYRLRPLALITHSGVEYLVALDVEAELHEKLFRLDRLAGVRTLDARFEPPQDMDLERFRTERLYFGADTQEAQVRFAPAVAREVSERFTKSDIKRETGGAVRVKLTTSSPAWLARWVLPFGVHAEVLAPEGARQMLAALCSEAAEAYRRRV
ncbi:MAG: WYL domain-containing protein [Deltaproteobacteria bacterium]|nr:WYL domain-containing protein [Deltaproteobacteria bacterium]